MKFSIDSILLLERGWGIICSDRFNSELTNIFFRPNSSSWPTIVLTRRNYSDSRPILSQAKIYWSSDQTEGVILEAWFVKRWSCIRTRLGENHCRSNPLMVSKDRTHQFCQYTILSHLKMTCVWSIGFHGAVILDWGGSERILWRSVLSAEA